MSRRILHIIDSLDYNGSATQLLLVAKGLKHQGFDVCVCALDRRAPRLADFEAAGIATAVIPRRWSLDPLADWKLIRHVRRLQPDVVHTWNTIPGTFAALAARRRVIAGQYRMRHWQTGWESFVEQRCVPRVSQFVTDSTAVREWCVRNGLPAQKLVVVQGGIEPARASDVSREELLRKLSLPADARLIGVVGRLVPVKRVKDLIWAADLLRVLHDNLRVLIIGDGPLRAQLEEYARLASDLDHIRFLGAGDDAWRIMPHLDVLWNGGEGVGQSAAILEAMAAGVPVVASDTPTNRELIVDGKTGYLIPLGTRAGRAARARYTDQIFSDAELAARLAGASRDRVVQNFSAEPVTKRYAEIYDSP